VSRRCRPGLGPPRRARRPGAAARHGRRQLYCPSPTPVTGPGSDSHGERSPNRRRRTEWTGTPTRISSVGRSISNKIFDIEDFDIECSSISMIFSFDIVYRYRTCSISRVTFLDIRRSRKGKSISKFRIFRCRPKILRYCIMISYTISKAFFISYTISKAFFTFDSDIEGHYPSRGRYRIRYSIHPMSFTAERKLPLPRRHHAGAEGSQRHEPWIPAPSFCAIPQLDPQRFDEERSSGFHSATSTC
jgi:hypothetical protein